MGCSCTTPRGLHELDIQDFDLFLGEFDKTRSMESLQAIQAMVDSGVVWLMPLKVSLRIADLIKTGQVKSRLTLTKETCIAAS